MRYKRLMVHLHMGQSNVAVLKAARTMAERLNAEVIGIMVGQQTQMIYGKAYSALDFFDREDEHIQKKLSEAEAKFHLEFESFSRATEWRSIITREPMTDYIAAEARSTDIIITGISPTDSYEGYVGASAGELVLKSGRPVLTIPTAIEKLSLDNVLIGWKDTREARRAIIDSLPLLRLAKQVTIIEIAPEAEIVAANEHLHDVVRWLMCHDITAERQAYISHDNDVTDFFEIIQEHNPTLVVVGAYGHSRLHEWVLGGVTNELLRQSNVCCLLSH